MTLIFSPKDPDDVDDFTLDWGAERLGTAETLSTAVFTVVAGGVTISAQSNTTTTATVRLAAGTAGTQAKVRCRVTTSLGRTLDHTEDVWVAQR